MRRNFKLDLRRGIVLALLAGNLIALWFVYVPFGGSAEDMEAQVAALRAQVRERRVSLDRTKRVANNIERGGKEGNEFVALYFLNRPTTYSTVVDELAAMAKRAGVAVREHSFVEDPVEGSEDMSMLSINGNYEGSYSDLLQFLAEVDKAPRLLIIESLAASPQQGTGVLNINLRANTFIRESADPAMTQSMAPGGGGGQ